MQSHAAPNIIQAMETVFAATFERGRNRETWRAWRAFLAACFALPMDGDAIACYRTHTGRTDLPTTQFREAFCVVGRRGGKSAVAALIACYLATFRDYSEVLAPGETGIVMLLAADRRQARVLLGYINGFFDNVPALRRLLLNRTQESLTLNNRIRIEIHTASFRAIRGYTVVAAICDELAYWAVEDAASPDVEVLNALRPAMSTIPNALLLAITSPYARRGAVWETYKENFGKDGADVLVWQGDTRSMNPTVSKLVIAAAYLRDHAAASAEYGAEFRTDIAAFLSWDVIERRVIPGRLELPPVPGVEYFAFVDPSGGQSDSMTLAIAHRHNDLVVLDLLAEKIPPFGPEAVVRDFVTTMARYHIHSVTGDRYGAEWTREAFQKLGITYRAAELTRSELYLEMLPMLTAGQCELLDNQRFVRQLLSLERRTSRLGRDSVDHPPSGHDDLANAAAGALVGALGHEIRLALVEFYKEEQAAREAAKVKPADDATCPGCGKVGSIVHRGPIKHCTACAHEFGGPPREVGPPARAELFERDRRHGYRDNRA
jgi:hypothetical protein